MHRAILVSLVLLGACSKPPFSEHAASAGLDFQHVNGMAGELYLAEIMGSGVGVFDYDNDGDLDVYLVQGGSFDAGPDRPDRLFRNDGGLRFTDVTVAAGIEAAAYGMGVTCGDVDNDGDTDLFRTSLGFNTLLRNNGDGTFTTETVVAGDEPRWSVSAAFVDYDLDGWLDLYVGNYVDFSVATNKPCRSSTSARDYCSPLVYDPQPDRLLRNDGTGRLFDASEQSGIFRATGSALGVTVGDFDSDGLPDIYVANDGMPNLLWRNSGSGVFRNIADIAGVAVNMDGRPEASMGVDSGDFDGDGDEDLFMTHLNRESNTLYVNEGSGYFDDRSVSLGLAGASLNYTGFGTAWFDYDNDGDLDLFSANGAVTKIQALIDAGDPFPLHQRNQLFANDGTGNYLEVSAESGLQLSEVSRGAAFGDLDNDGDPDIVVANNNGPVRLLRNNTGHRSDWIGFRVLTADGLRDALGARVRLLRDNKPLVARIGTDGSYASCNDARVVFGLGDETEDSFSVEVAWPGGVAHRFENLAPNRYHELVPP